MAGVPRALRSAFRSRRGISVTPLDRRALPTRRRNYLRSRGDPGRRTPTRSFPEQIARCPRNGPCTAIGEEERRESPRRRQYRRRPGSPPCRTGPLPPSTALRQPRLRHRRRPPRPRSAARRAGWPVFRSGASLVALNVTVSDGKRLVARAQAGRLRGLRRRRAAARPVLRVERGADRSDPPHRHQRQHGRQDGRRPRRRCRVLRRFAIATAARSSRFGDRVNIVQPLTDDREAARAGRPRRAGAAARPR